jgi:DNA-binding NarL/FixJ family response regulator
MIAYHFPRVRPSHEPKTLDPSRIQHSAIAHLTSRERQVLLLLFDGMSTAEICRKIARSHSRVSKLRSTLMRRLGVRGESELMQFAAEHRLIDPKR